MKKLTKEQADWLIEKIKIDAQAECFGGGELKYSEVVERTINQCTEKEFPEFNGTWSCPNGGGALGLRKSIGNNYIFIYQDDKYVLSVTPNEFKQFTEGCNKIVEWLNEQ